ncbi:hypothetical protein NKJ35_08300 [Mesorhizobium sp. M0136]|uniref:hypothetical protein n=1 Tax=Mesorhizobium sp. M0136 TaxID=2956890 RepID=UPI00333C9AD5
MTILDAQSAEPSVPAFVSVSPSSTTIDVISGISLGFLTGLLVGLTTASVTSSVISSLLALVVAIVGLSKDSNVLFSTNNSIRLSSFAFAAIISVLLGLYMRTHDLLSPSPAQLYNELKLASYSDDDARSLVRFKIFGILPSDAKAADPGDGAINTVNAI